MLLFPTELVLLTSTTFHPNRNPNRGKDGISLTTGNISVGFFNKVRTGMPPYVGGLDSVTPENKLRTFF